MKRVLLRLSVAFAVFLGVSLPGLAGQLQAATTIQPGDSITSVGKGCTLGFAATGGESTYFMTAAHCVDSIGDGVALDDGTVFADVVARGNPNVTQEDWSLMEVRAPYVPAVAGAVRGIAGAPFGFTTASQAVLGHIIRFSGHGVPWYIDARTRENRYGVVVTNDAEMYTAIGLDTQGDSGGPIIHQKTKKAYGLVSRLCVGLCTSEGPTVQGIIAKAAAQGFSLTIKNG